MGCAPPYWNALVMWYLRPNSLSQHFLSVHILLVSMCTIASIINAQTQSYNADKTMAAIRPTTQLLPATAIPQQL